MEIPWARPPDEHFPSLVWDLHNYWEQAIGGAGYYYYYYKIVTEWWIYINICRDTFKLNCLEKLR